MWSGVRLGLLPLRSYILRNYFSSIFQALTNRQPFLVRCLPSLPSNTFANETANKKEKKAPKKESNEPKASKESKEPKKQTKKQTKKETNDASNQSSESPSVKTKRVVVANTHTPSTSKLLQSNTRLTKKLEGLSLRDSQLREKLKNALSSSQLLRRQLRGNNSRKLQRQLERLQTKFSQIKSKSELELDKKKALLKLEKQNYRTKLAQQRENVKKQKEQILARLQSQQQRKITVKLAQMRRQQDKIRREKERESRANAPKRSLSAYFYFVQSLRDKMKDDTTKVSNLEFMKLAADKWKNLQDRTPFVQLAAEDKQRYLQEKSNFQGSKKARARSGYQLFVKELFPVLKEQYPAEAMSQITAKLAARWKELSEFEKNDYNERAKSGI